MEILKHFEPVIRTRLRYLLCYGGAGSGKSYSVAEKIIIRITSEKPHKILCVRKVYRTLKESCFALFKSIVYKEGLQDVFIFNTSPLEITFIPNGNRIVFAGLDNPEKLKSITDITAIWIEEATELEACDLDQLDLRLRGEPTVYHQIAITFNPIDELHFLRERFFNKAEDTFLHHSTMLDNPKRGEKYDEVIGRFKINNPSYYKVYGLGEWGTLATGHIFTRDQYKEYDSIPDDLKSVLYCDPNLAIKAKGDTTAITEIGYSPRSDAYYVVSALCRSYSDSNELLNTVLKLKQDSPYCLALGFDGNVTQESTWTNHVKSWCRIHESPFPVIDYKRYAVDNLVKNISLRWAEGKILFPPMFREQIQNREYIGQVFAFEGKKAGNPDDAPDSLVCAFEFLNDRKYATQKNKSFKQPDIEPAYSF